MTKQEITALARRIYGTTGFRAVDMRGAPLAIRCQLQSRDEDGQRGTVAFGATWNEVAERVKA